MLKEQTDNTPIPLSLAGSGVLHASLSNFHHPLIVNVGS